MKLDTLSLQNFRQFRDEEISFARGETRNVTVIHGSNGSGKTTLLNAFTWLLYEEVDFDTRPERLASEGAMAAADPGDEVTVSVTLEFSHDDADYTATRTATYEKQSPTDFDGILNEPTLVVEYDDGSGVNRPENPGEVLSQIIPERLSELFFFDGEDIDELAGIDNQDRIQEAIQNIMGLTILERATRHLGDVADRFESQVQDSASEELRELIDEKQATETDIEDLQRKKKDKERAIERVGTEISDIDQKLERLDESAQLQENREAYREDVTGLEDDVDEINAQIKAAITENGFIPLAMPLIRESAQEIDQLRKDGVIPSELSDDFLNSLLEAKQCLCGRDLEHDSEPYDHVASLRGEVASDGVEQGALRVVGHLRQFTDGRTEFFDDVDELIERRQEKHEQIDRLEERISSISSELKGLDATTPGGQSISDLETDRENKQQEKEQLIADRGGIEEQISSKEADVEELEADIAEQKDEQAETQLARRRQRAAELVETDLANNFEALKDKVRTWSNQEVNDTFGKIASKNLEAEITEEFELKIQQSVEDQQVEVDKSTGERQIASLAFVGSLVKIAKKRYEAGSESEYFTGGIYPLVMDSPFGALDKDHRREVSRILPTLASQVVVFATDSQWEGPVEEEMSDIAGEQYWLDFDDGEGTNKSPQTQIKGEQAAQAGD
ncbi:DNA sulfur modification protein DndD [Halomicrobium zhouii]|uniref:DNA sulfur modification protein DndD n=1 Tax=Halomicrobium zhouii TaxID=767519 RepID=A0A1I6L045_9EURY|nr:AAA family ATPase [Halomicrobium zhouii]SFR96863.1 DNA sulfur modification protein DndD [Halomicrobium zhouii]